MPDAPRRVHPLVAATIATAITAGGQAYIDHAAEKAAALALAAADREARALALQRQDDVRRIEGLEERERQRFGQRPVR